jgi:hypothetical protein
LLTANLALLTANLALPMADLAHAGNGTGGAPYAIQRRLTLGGPDAANHRVYLVAAEIGAAPAPSADQPHPRAPVIEGSFNVLVVGN